MPISSFARRAQSSLLAMAAKYRDHLCQRGNEPGQSIYNQSKIEIGHIFPRFSSALIDLT